VVLCLLPFFASTHDIMTAFRDSDYECASCANLVLSRRNRALWRTGMLIPNPAFPPAQRVLKFPLLSNPAAGDLLRFNSLVCGGSEL
jgi:hypothetical protein